MRIDEFEFQDRNGNEIEPTKNQLVIYIKSLHKQITELQKQLKEKTKTIQGLVEVQKLLEESCSYQMFLDIQKQLEEKEKEIYNYRNCFALKDEAYNQLLEEYNERISEKKQAHILNDRLGERIKWLENQIKSQPSEIVDKIRKEVGLKLKYKLNNEVCVLKICNQINEVLDTILEEYQK